MTEDERDALAARLSEKADGDRHRKIESEGEFKEEGPAPDAVCPNCGRAFRIDGKNPVCPKCGFSWKIEEEDVSRKDLALRLSERASEDESRRAASAGLFMTPPAKKPVPFDDGMDQDSLDPDSPEYKAYAEDLRRHEDEKKNDEFHDELESSNAEVGVRLAMLAEKQDAGKDLNVRRQNIIQRKMDIHDQTVNDLAKEAELTPGEYDDKAVAGIGTRNRAMLDITVDEKEYHSQLEDDIGMIHSKYV